MPQVCGANDLYPSESLYPSDTLGPGSGEIFVPTLPLSPLDFPIDTSAAIFVSADEPISLARFYSGRLFNDLPEYFQGLPLQQLPGRRPLPDYEDDPGNLEARWWGLQRILLRAFGRELARLDYIIRGRVSLADFANDPRLPHATQPDDANVFELTYEDDFVLAEASFVNPATVRFSEYDTVTTRTATGDVTASSPVINNMSSTVGLVAGTAVSGTGIPVGARILSVNSSTQVTLTMDATATNAGVTLTFTFTRHNVEEFRTNRATVKAEATGPAGPRYVFAHRINDQMTVELVASTGGTWLLGYFGDYTNPLQGDGTETAANIQAELEGLAGIEPGDVLVTDITVGSKWQIDLTGGLAGTDIRQFDPDSTLLTGTDPEAVVTTVRDGSAGFDLVLDTAPAPPDADSVLIGTATWDGTNVTAVTTDPDRVGGPVDGLAYYDPFLDPMANNGINPACSPLSQNEGIPAQFFAATANWGLDLWESMLGLEIPSKNPVNTMQYPERRARILRALVGTRASTGAEFSWLAAERARELGITLGEFEEAQYTDPGWDDPNFVIPLITETQYWALNNATSGTYTAEILGVVSGPIAWNDGDLAIQAILEAMPNINPGDITVTTFTNGPLDPVPHGTFFQITFDEGGQYEGTDIPTIIFDTTNLVGLLPSVGITTLQNGGPGLNEIQQVALTNVTQGSLPLQYGAEITSYFSYAATADDVKNVLTPLNGIASNDLIVTGAAGGPWEIEFQDNLAETNVVALTCPDTSLLGGVPATVLQGTLKDPYALTTLGVEKRLDGAPAESTYPWWIWATVYAIEDLDTDPVGAAARVATLRAYLDQMTPAHLRVGFDWGPIGGFIVDISIVGVDRV